MNSTPELARLKFRAFERASEFPKLGLLFLAI